jgi:hypothetical protein
MLRQIQFFSLLALFGSAFSTKEVGIFYWTWFPEAWGFGSWGTPALGYYDSKDYRIIDQHTEWLKSAGVDFVLIDWSNNCKPYGDPENPNFLEDGTKAFANRQAERRNNGQSFLQFALMLGTCGDNNNLHNGAIYNKAQQVLDWFVSNSDISPVYWRYRTVPFLGLFAISSEQEAESFNHPAFWTRVLGGGLSGRGLIDSSYGSRFITYEDRFESLPSYDNLYENEGYTSHTVQVGCRSPNGWDDCPNNNCRCRDNGNTFRDWWNVANSRNVDLVLVHSFNQWGGPGEEKNQECSTDIEPMQGGHDSIYLTYLQEGIASFKNYKNGTKLEFH